MEISKSNNLNRAKKFFHVQLQPLISLLNKYILYDNKLDNTCNEFFVILSLSILPEHIEPMARSTIPGISPGEGTNSTWENESVSEV